MRLRREGDILECALDLDPNNPPYLLELGRLRRKQPFRRIEAERFFAKVQHAAHATVLGLPHQVEFAVALGEEGDYTYVLDRAAPAVHRLRSDFPLR